MKVLYWNLCNEVDPHASLQEARQLIEDEQIDVACFQEVPYVPQEVEGRKINVPLSQLLADEFDMEQTFEHTRTIRKTDDRIKGYGSAILSRSSFVEQQTSIIRDDRFSYMTDHPENQRVLLSARVEAEPDVVVNVAHMSYALPLNIGKKGLKSEHRTLASILQEQMKQFEVVFGGDLNAKPKTAVDTLLEKLGLRSVLDNLAPTFRSRHWFAGHIKRNLDRVFISSGLSGQGHIGDRKQSDHHPIIVTIDKR